MTEQKRHQAKELFLRALELSAEDRPAFLNRACGGDEGLRAEVERLLQAHEGAGAFLGAPTVGMPAGEFPTPLPGGAPGSIAASVPESRSRVCVEFEAAWKRGERASSRRSVRSRVRLLTLWATRTDSAVEKAMT